MLNDITVITGFRCCGKTKKGKILLQALNNNTKVRLVDMSDAIKYYLARPETDIGRQLQQYRALMDDGGVIPDGRLIYTMTMKYLAMLDRQDGRQTEHLILTGGMRTVEEARCLNQCGIRVTVIHIIGDKGNMYLGVKRRLEAGDLRPDSMSTEKLERGWTDYQHLTIPALKLCPRYHEISFRLTLRDSIVTCIGIVQLPENVKAKMLRRIKTRDHKACIAIEELDKSPKPVAKVAHAAHSTVPAASTHRLEVYETSPVPPRESSGQHRFALAT